MNSTPWIAAAVAFGVCVITLPVIRTLASRSQLFDSSGPLKIHTRPIPRLGGIAIALGLLMALVTARHGGKPSLAFVVAFLLLWITGLIDDVWSLPPGVRLAAQLGSALVLCLSVGAAPLYGPKALSLAVGILFVVILVNAFNFLDGADGVAASVGLVIALGYIVTGATRTNSSGNLLAWILSGCCLGFLLFNFPPATIFMGDSGSTALGFVIAFMSLEFCSRQPGSGRNLIVPLVFAGLPLLDFFLAVLRRWRKGASPFLGDRQHFYDLLLQRGWSPREVALCCCGSTALLVGAGWVCMRGEGILALAAAPLVVGCLLVTSIQLGSLRHSSDPAGVQRES